MVLYSELRANPGFIYPGGKMSLAGHRSSRRILSLQRPWCRSSRRTGGGPRGETAERFLLSLLGEVAGRPVRRLRLVHRNHRSGHPPQALHRRKGRTAQVPGLASGKLPLLLHRFRKTSRQGEGDYHRNYRGYPVPVVPHRPERSVQVPVTAMHRSSGKTWLTEQRGIRTLRRTV